MTDMNRRGRTDDKEESLYDVAAAASAAASTGPTAVKRRTGAMMRGDVNDDDRDRGGLFGEESAAAATGAIDGIVLDAARLQARLAKCTERLAEERRLLRDTVRVVDARRRASELRIRRLADLRHALQTEARVNAELAGILGQQRSCNTRDDSISISGGSGGSSDDTEEDEETPAQQEKGMREDIEMAAARRSGHVDARVRAVMSALKGTDQLRPMTHAKNDFSM